MVYRKHAGKWHIDTPGGVYLTIVVDRTVCSVVLSLSFAGAEVQKTKVNEDMYVWEFARVVNGDGL